ncbi:MAG: hypothetical protein PHD51_03785 [Patescibacteria group bacterium]|nr:hypothetical protein [Patescibacteria group bacterium]MDD5490908.1 hypothetical protein [Patescibacteria group bacterium]
MFKKVIKHLLIDLILALLFGIGSVHFYFNPKITQLNEDLTLCQKNQIKAGVVGISNGGGTGLNCEGGSGGSGCVGTTESK